jgi:hypothetical protein
MDIDALVGFARRADLKRWNMVHCERLCRGDPPMTRNNLADIVDKYRVHETKARDRFVIWSICRFEWVRALRSCGMRSVIARSITDPDIMALPSGILLPFCSREQRH